MEKFDLLYSGMMLTAFILSLWTAILVSAAFVFFAPFRFLHVSAPSTSREPVSSLDGSARSKLEARSS